MGNQLINEKPPIDILCSQIILANAEKQFTMVEKTVIDSLKTIRYHLKDKVKGALIISELKSGIKGIPSIIYCIM